jgi:hypothetical protein
VTPESRASAAERLRHFTLEQCVPVDGYSSDLACTPFRAAYDCDAGRSSRSQPGPPLAQILVAKLIPVKLQAWRGQQKGNQRCFDLTPSRCPDVLLIERESGLRPIAKGSGGTKRRQTAHSRLWLSRQRMAALRPEQQSAASSINVGNGPEAVLDLGVGSGQKAPAGAISAMPASPPSGLKAVRNRFANASWRYRWDRSWRFSIWRLSALGSCRALGTEAPCSAKAKSYPRNHTKPPPNHQVRRRFAFGDWRSRRSVVLRGCYTRKQCRSGRAGGVPAFGVFRRRILGGLAGA